MKFRFGVVGRKRPIKKLKQTRVRCRDKNNQQND